MPELNLHVEPVPSAPGVAVVAIRGSIDPRNLSQLESILGSASGQGFETLVLDLAEIRYINSAGLAYLVNFSDQLASRGGRLELAGAQPKVKLIFEMMGLTEFFTLYKTVESALAAVAPARRRTSMSARRR